MQRLGLAEGERTGVVHAAEGAVFESDVLVGLVGACADRGERNGGVVAGEASETQRERGGVKETGGDCTKELRMCSLR